MPLPAGTKLGTHENSRLHLPHSSRFAWHFQNSRWLSTFTIHMWSTWQ